ncbi:MAG: glycosyltransferase family 39 protein [Bryobacteraceae bacterium]|jgi:hypothetical protein|nr:glycosyltransferase family 39 protein [Bryobacteraceae bacterium]
MFSRSLAVAGLVISISLFLLTGFAFLDRPGIQTDEALIARALFPATGTEGLLGSNVPPMVMSYVGSFKALLWKPVVALFTPSALTLRAPAVLLAAATVWLFFHLLARTLDYRAALIGAILLATDPSYLFTSRYDWGPVVLQHVCLLGAMVALVHFYQRGRRLFLAGGFLLLGLGVWDKALFLWSIASLAIATAVVFPYHLKKVLGLRNVVVAVLSFCAGAFPFLQYNVENGWITFRENTAIEKPAVADKARVLRVTIEGSGLFGFFFREDSEAAATGTANLIEKAVVAFNDAVKRPRRTLSGYLLLACALLLPAVWRTPARAAVLFSLLFSLATWLQMLLVRGTGGGIHHTILLWPVLLIAPAATLASISRLRWLGGPLLAPVAVVAAVASNLLVTSTYLSHLIRNGGKPTWTEAIYPAAETLSKMDAPYIDIYDWGLWDNLWFLTSGQIRLRYSPVHTTPAEVAALAQIFENDPIFVGFVDGSEMFPEVNRRLNEVAASFGYVVSDRQTFLDSHGRPVIQALRFRRQSP